MESTATHIDPQADLAVFGYPQLLWVHNPANGRSETILCFNINDVQRVIEKYDGKCNIYFHPNRARANLKYKRPEKRDIDWATCLFVDIDPPPGIDYRNPHAIAEARRAMWEKIRSYRHTPSLIVDSGNGYQCYWILAWMFEVNGEPGKIEEIEARNRAIMQLFGADKCWEVAHCFRVPHTTNVPDAKKQAQGRVARRGSVVYTSPARYSLEDFEKAPPVTKGKAKPGATILPFPDQPATEDRSRSVSKIVHSQVDKGLDTEQICDVVRANKHLADRYKTDDDLRQDVERIAGKHVPGPASDPCDINGNSLLPQLEQFHAYLPQHSFIYIPTGATWPASSVNSQIASIYLGKDDKDKDKFMQASQWIDRHRPVQQMTWAPGEDELIEDRLIFEGGWKRAPGNRVFNLYRPPVIKPGNAKNYGPWWQHIGGMYGEEQGKHVVYWLAHRVQRPHEKPNHALVLGGAQGIGKDTILVPVTVAVGPWNFREVSPKAVIGRFNGFLKSVVLRISEGHDLGDVSRYDFYESMKTYTAAPPDVLLCDEKNLEAHSVPNLCGVIITTNHKTDGIYLPADDRRHYVAWSDKTKADYSAQYWNEFHGWYERGGSNDVAAFLRTLDLSSFNAKAPPPKTQAFWDIVDSNRSPEAAELADVMDALQWPDAFVLKQLIDHAKNINPSLASFLLDRTKARRISYRIEALDYIKLRNPADARDGLWRHNGQRTAVYVKKTLAVRDQHAVAQVLCQR